MQPISIEKQEIIVAAKERGKKAKTITQWLNVSADIMYHVYHLTKKESLDASISQGEKVF